MKNRNTKYLVFLCLVIFIAACNVQEKFVQPKVEIADTFNNTAEVDSSSFSDLQWWEMFNDTTLILLINEGLNNNIPIQNMAIGIKQAQLQYEIARSMLSPQLGYGAQGTLDGNTVETGLNYNVLASVNVSYTLDFWGRLSNQRDASFQAYLATEIAYYQVRASLIAQIASLYFTLRDVDNKIIVAEEMIENMTKFRDVIDARYMGGFVSKVDINQADIQLKGAEFTLQSLHRTRTQIENALSIAIGSQPKEIKRGLPIEEQLLPDELPSGVPIYLLKRRPDILISERELMAQLRTIDATQALKYPNITLSFDLGTQLFNPALIFSQLGANLVGPIFNRGRINKSINIQEEQYNILVNNYVQTYYIALQEVEDALIGIDTYQNEFEIRNEQLDLSSEALDLSWVRYNEGVTPLLDFLNLQKSLFTSQLQVSESYKLRLQSMVKLYLALGGGWDYTQYSETEVTQN